LRVAGFFGKKKSKTEMVCWGGKKKGLKFVLPERGDRSATDGGRRGSRREEERGESAIRATKKEVSLSIPEVVKEGNKGEKKGKKKRTTWFAL